ncbi:16S rRNA (guanine(966)-N(2))-methyltransferase RsmD [Tolumonas lignilytica]|uniref:16S rRNA (guanine(966)-N(2))-methyltransferase RsmD n=1 Tax=Tolumonas lignilytica TaxID=1283284 RepID=UPI00046524C6|nr:16S rRNA (guanine(966)-N(2))-methyltransferase RsmD [Tolumonas lignilytica]
MARSKSSASRSTPASGRSGTIRLISGQWRGRKLPVHDVEGLRPTTDRVKETLFNWLATEVRDSRCLDVFAGSGSLGFEALSRYAGYVMMIEQEPKAARQLQQNLQTLQCEQAQIVCRDAIQVLQNPCSEPFELVFLDPPFRKNLLLQVIPLLEQQGWLAKRALIYLERENEGEAPEIPPNWQLLKDKQAGQVRYQLYLRESTTE